jgi:hypothetical protein
MHCSNHLVWCFMIIFLQTSRPRLSEPVHVLFLPLKVLPIFTGILPVPGLVIYYNFEHPLVTLNPLGPLISLPSTCYSISLLMAISSVILLIGNNMQCMNKHPCNEHTPHDPNET